MEVNEHVLTILITICHINLSIKVGFSLTLNTGIKVITVIPVVLVMEAQTLEFCTLRLSTASTQRVAFTIKTISHLSFQGICFIQVH